jgi:cytochrome d ubiquinol oxidase subunit II
MLFDYETLKLIWWLLIGILLIGFAIMDGMDLGVANLLPFLGRTDNERRVIINAVGPHWDGNQVWLITAGGAIFAAWPFVYAAAFSGLYMGLLLVLFALFFRPLGFDYRSKIDNPVWRNSWDWGLFASGFVPSLVFGVAFGNLLQGVPFYLDNMFMSHYEKSFIFALLGLLNPFALLCGLLSVSMITLHGALWLQVRTDGLIAQRAKTITSPLALATVVLFALGGVWIAYGITGYHVIEQANVGGFPNPLGKTVSTGVGIWLDNYESMPFLLIAPALGFSGVILAGLLSYFKCPGCGFIASALGLFGIIATAGVSMFPFVMPSSTHPESGLTLWDATSSHKTLMLMLWAVAIFLPIVLSYTTWCFIRMWGKVTTQGIEDKKHSIY